MMIIIIINMIMEYANVRMIGGEVERNNILVYLDLNFLYLTLANLQR